MVLLILAFMVWATPRTMVFGPGDPARHTFSTAFGLMSPKMAAVMTVIILLYVSWLFYRRAGKVFEGRQLLARLVWIIVAAAAAAIIAINVRGFFIPVDVRIRESTWQIMILTGVIVVTFIMDTLALRKARTVGPIEWGRVPVRSQYVLIALAFVIVWLMGLMGYARSAVRTNWHVDALLEDTSPWAWLPALGEVANTVTLITLIFFGLLAISFAVSIYSERERVVPEVRLPAVAGGADVRGEPQAEGSP